MLDEKKTKKQLIDDIKLLREHLAFLQRGQSPLKNSDVTVKKTLAWKDFLLGLHEKSHDFTDEALYRYILDEVVRLTQSDIGFLHLVSEDQQSVILTCWHEKALQHCTASHETHYPVDQAGNWADCLHLKRPVVYNDFSQAPNWKGLPPGHNPILRFMGIPVIEQGKMRIILGVGNKSEDYDDEDVFQTQLVANNLQSILTRRRVEKQLRENEERLFLSLQATQDAIWDWDIVQGTGYASLNYFTMLGYKPDEFLMNSEYWWHLIHCDDVQKVREAMDRVVNNPDSWEDSIPKVEFRMQKKTGEWRWILARGKVVTWDREGRPLRMMGTHTDITDRKLAEEALRESESKFKDLVEQSNVGVYLIQDGLFKYVNAKFAEIFGYGIDEVMDKMGPKDVVFADDLPLVEKNINRRISGEFKDIHYNFRIVTKTGEIRYIEVYSSRTAYRGRIAVIGTLLDLTERRQMVEALRQNEATLRGVFNASPIGLCAMRGRVFQSANKAWYDLFGYTEAEIIGHTTRMLYENDGEYERIGRELYENLKDRGLASVQTRIKRKDGVLRDVIVTAAPLEREYLFHGTVVTIEDITDRKQADAELQYRNTLLTTQLEASMDGILVVDEAGRMIFFNQRFVEMWRIPDEVVSSRSDVRALQSIRVLLEDPDSYIEKVNYLHAHRDETSRDDVCLRDGRSFDRYSAPVVGKDGCYYGRIWQFRDMTDYKQAQEDLRKSEAAYREIFNAVTEAIFIHDLCTGEIVDVNNSMLEMFGYDREEARRLRVVDLSSSQIPYTQETADELIAKAAGGEPQVFEWCGRRKNGQLFPEEISLKKGVIAGQACVLAVVRDISERKQTEEALRDSERRLNDVIDFLPDATLVIDRYGKVQAWNRTMEVMTGVKKQDMLGKGDYEYALPFYGTRRPILIDLVLHQDEAVANQYVTIRRFGDALFAETRVPNLPPGDVILAATASVLRDFDGEIIAAIECIRDVTHQTRLESKLRQAQKMEAIGTLAGGIAHDFNNILASTIGYTELAIMNIGKPNLLNGYLEQVMKACDRAKNLVNQILVFSRQREQERKPVDMTVIVKEALKLLRASLPSTIKINHHFPAEPATVFADPTQIHQIAMNLCTNAAQAMRENGGELDVNLSHFSVSTTMVESDPVFKAGAYVQLVVKDTGHGIDPAIIDKIFDPFFTTKRHQEGTGLGLSVVYGIVNSYDGHIQVQSELGQGTIFNVYIPAIEQIKVASEQKTKKPISGGTESLLLVDDEELLVQVMENYLGALGYDVVSSTSSPEALYMVQENPCRFDLMVTDMTMPHMTGLKLCREVLAINPLLPIILCTGYNESITEAEVKRSGIKEFVLKPVSLQKMAYLIRQVLDMQ